MLNQQIGAELSQLARLLFDSAANKWFISMGLELAAVVIGVTLNLIVLPESVAVWGAASVLIVFTGTYALRLFSEAEVETAETMRRQSVLSEGLDWPVSPWQLTEWRTQVGSRIRRRFENEQRAADYFSTQQPVGALKLAEMTTESAFYTRQVYLRLRYWIWALLVLALLMFILGLTALVARSLPQELEPLAARGIFALAPLFLTMNVMGLAFRLGRLIYSIGEVERAFEQLSSHQGATEPQVLRLVSEYNCQVSNRIPVPTWLYKVWHDEIRRIWEHRP